MFHQVRQSWQSQQYCRFWWRFGDTNKPWKTYIYRRTVFGLVDSPFKCVYLCKQTAERCGVGHTHGVGDPIGDACFYIKNFLYMDDLLLPMSFEPAYCAKVVQAVKNILESASFFPHKFLANDPAILKLIPEDLCSHDLEKNC